MALLDDGSTACPSGTEGMNVLPDFFLSESKSREGNITAERLHGTMEDAARQHGWTFVDAHRRAFRGRGICTGYTPEPLTLDGEWTPYNPAQWRAYAPRRRWFRTPNDAFMTGNFHVSESLLQKALKTEKL